MNKFTEVIHFKYLDTLIWSLPGPFSEEFVVGFLYGALHAITSIAGEDSYYHFDFYAQRTAHSYNKRLFVLRRFPEYFIRKAQKTEINRRLTTKNVRYDHYAIWLAYKEKEANNNAWLVQFRTLDLLQGLFTSLKGFGIVIDYVLLTMPIKNNVLYKIEGLYLLNPNDLYAPDLIIPPPIEDIDDEEYYDY